MEMKEGNPISGYLFLLVTFYIRFPALPEGPMKSVFFPLEFQGPNFGICEVLEFFSKSAYQIFLELYLMCERERWLISYFRKIGTMHCTQSTG